MKYLTEDPSWIQFYPKLNNAFFIEKAGYFDERPRLHTSITQLFVFIALPFLCFWSMWFLLLTPLIFYGWGKLCINFPIKTGIQDCQSAAWGYNYHDNRIWIYIGGGSNFEGGKKWKTITMPWFMTWVRTSTKINPEFTNQIGTKTGWFHETRKNKLNWGNDPDGLKIGGYYWLRKCRWKESYHFTDKYDGTVVTATIHLQEREWRPLWFLWTSLFAKTHKTIQVDFDKPIGKRKNDWKGGTIGCSYKLLPNETPLECLKRMEKEREF